MILRLSIPAILAWFMCKHAQKIMPQPQQKPPAHGLPEPLASKLDELEPFK